MRTFARGFGVLGSIPNIQPDTTRVHQEGLITPFEDTFFGCGEAIYARAAGAISPMAPVMFTPVYDSTEKRWVYAATALAYTANLGKPVAVYMGNTALADTNYGWFQIAGLTPAAFNASVAANTAFSVRATGKFGAWATTYGINNAVVVAPSSTTVVKSAYLTNGSKVIRIPNADGWWRGMPLTGTSVGSSALIESFSNDGKIAYVDVASTATITTNVTGTYNDGTIHWNVVHLNRPFALGAA